MALTDYLKFFKVRKREVAVSITGVVLIVLGCLAWLAKVALADRSETKSAIASLVASTQARQVQSDLRYQELTQKFVTIDTRGERIESKLDSLIQLLLTRRLAEGREQQ